MKIILTGYTSPVGSILYKHLSKTHEVMGISHADYDLLSSVDMHRLIEQSKTVDHFINLANITTQADILYKVHKTWTQLGKDGKIISFGTLATHVPHSLLERIPIDMQMLASKLSLEKIHNELSLVKPFGIQPQSVLLRFANYGIKTDHRANEPSTTDKQLTDIIDFVINNSTYISTIDFREIV